MEGTKYPVVLVHGIMIKDIYFVRAFGRIDRHLKEQGYSVFVSNHDGLGSIENNAQQIKDFVLGVLNKTNADKVNIIAHSKGGLDSRYMISKLEMQDKVASLTTISTPHGGSKVATKILTLPRFCKGFLAFWLNFYYKIFKDKNPDSLLVAQQLSCEYLEKFNIDTPNSTNVYYQSYYTTLNKSRDDFIMGIPLKFSKTWEGDDSDGVVARTSAIWGECKGKAVEESLSHSQIIDFMTAKSKRQKVLEFYTNLCKELQLMGF